MNGKKVALNARGHRVGETHHRAKLTDADIAMIFELHEDITDDAGNVIRKGLGYRQIAKKFDETVTDPVTGQEVPGYRPGWSTIRDVIKGNTRASPIARWAWIVSGEVKP